HGWVGKLAATAPEAWGHRGGPGAPAATIASGGSNAGSLVDFRKESVGDGLALFAILGTFGVVVVVGLLSGIVLLIVGAVLVGTGTLKRWSTPWRDEFAELKPGLRGGRVWLETFTLFSLGFLALVGLRYVIPFRRMGVDPLWFGLLSQWVLVLVLLWPVARGVPWRMTRALVGWHRGRGVAREVMFGVGAYLASLPVYVVAVLIVVVLMMLYEMITGRKAVPPSADRLVDMASGGLLQTIMVFLLVVVWAPVVEESIFRGNLYRLVRGKAGALAAVVISAGAFALMHPYLMVQLVAIFSLGAVFALMRESRGSLIPSMTAHALHNGTVFTLLTLLIHFGSDR
ncbi:MAG: lysostaphin resistance A-like protein, partial [Phycisphaerales bacterium]